MTPRDLKKRILFVSHDASQTGAPIAMLNFLEWLKDKELYEFEIFLKVGGPLTSRFKAIAHTYDPVSKNLIQRASKKVISKFFTHKSTYQLPTELIKKKYDLIYINTIDCLDITSLLKKAFDCPIICHVHENNFTIKNYFPGYLSKSNLQNIVYFIAVSNSTRENLIENYGIQSSKISLVYECISLKQVKKPSATIDAVKAELGLKDEFVVGGCGLTTWRKGADLFIQLAAAINRLKPNNNIKLFWTGNNGKEFMNQYEYEEERLAITDKLFFIGQKSVPANYFQVFDVFALTSREDPFPLVVLEAASQNKPVICFENSGGIPELIANNKGGVTVPYGNVEEMAKQIIHLQEQPEKLTLMGIEAGGLVEKFDVDVIGRQLVIIINDYLTK